MIQRITGTPRPESFLPSGGADLAKGEIDFTGVCAGGRSRPRGGPNTGITSHSILEPFPCQRGQGEVEGEDGKSEVRQGYEGP